MKLLIILTLFSLPLFAQQNEIPKTRIGVLFSAPAANQIFTFQSLQGSASYNNKGTFGFGVSLENAISSKMVLETGINYAKHSTFIEPAPQGIPLVGRSESVKLISVPALVKLYWANYFFINGGLLIDIDVSKSNDIDSQTGVGTLLGVGVKYDFKSGVSLQANPNLKLHGLLPFSKEKYHQRMLETGIQFSLLYSLR